MPIYKGSTNQGLIYYGSSNTNCLTSVPKNVKLELTYGAWTQPIFSSNTNGGLTLSASHESTPAWYAFNGDKTTGDNCWWTNHGVTSTSNPCWIQLKSTIKLKLNQVVIRNEHNTPENFKTAYLQVSNDGSSWTNVVTISGTNTGGYETTVNFTVSDGYYYYRLYFTESYSSGGVSIQTITFSGIAQNILTFKAGSKVYVPNGFDINTSIVGSPIINNGIVSGLTSGNYVKTPNQLNLTTATDWEIVIKYTHLADGSLRGFCGLLTGDNVQCNFYITDSNTVQSDGVWGNLESSTSLIVGSTYWTKLQFTGSQYILSLSTNGKDFINQSVIDSTTKVSLEQSFAFGCDRNTNSINDTVSIDLTQSYIKINGELWWQGKVGSGQPKFDVVTIESDVSVYFAGVGRGQCMAFYQPDVNTLGWYPTNECVSGTTQTGAVFYNTSTNTIKFIGEDQRGSLPFGIIYETNGSGISSIDQIFDWCGFIGSTAFVLPGVKGLIPYGFNADGTYRSVEFATDKVLTTTRTWDVAASFVQKLFIYNRGKALGIQNYQIESDSMPTVNDWTVWYNPKENIQRWNNSSNTLTDISQWTVDTTMRYIGEIPSDGTSRITSLVPTTVQPLRTVRPIANVYKGSTLVYESKLPAGQTVFEQAAAGTYTVTLPKTQNYRLIMVGGGGGGASGGSGHYTNYNAGGGSGGYVEVIVKLNKGSYTVSVGAIGAHGSGSSAGLYYGTAGGATTAFGFTAGGGQGGRCSIHSGGPLGGAGGSNTLATYVQLVANTTGNTGATSGGSYNVSGGASVYGSYGRGQNAYGDAGVAGYIKIVTA